MRMTDDFARLTIGAATLVAMVGAAVADGMPAGKPVASAPAAVQEATPSRACYVRADVGYGWAAGDHAVATTSQPNYLPTTGNVRQPEFDGSWFGEIGFGCSFVRQSYYSGSIKDQGYTVSTPTGLRGDITFGFHGSRDFKGCRSMH